MSIARVLAAFCTSADLADQVNLAGLTDLADLTNLTDLAGLTEWSHFGLKSLV